PRRGCRRWPGRWRRHGSDSHLLVALLDLALDQLIEDLLRLHPQKGRHGLAALLEPRPPPAITVVDDKPARPDLAQVHLIDLVRTALLEIQDGLPDLFHRATSLRMLPWAR